MGFSIKEFKAATDSGIARPNLYQATIDFGPLNNFGRKQLRILCESAELPGRRFDTTPELTYGVARKMPFGTAYDDMSLTFICTNRMEERYWFDRWMSFVCNPTSNYMHYYDNYKATITVELFSSTGGRPKYTVYVEEAYPISVLPQQLSYGDENNYLKLTVDFAYRRWRNDAEIESANRMIQENGGRGHKFNPRITGGNSSNQFTGEYRAPRGNGITQQTDYESDFRDFYESQRFGGFTKDVQNLDNDPDIIAAQQNNSADSAGPDSRVDAVPGSVVTNETSD